MKVEDKLNFQNNLYMKGKIGEEKIYFSDKIQKKTVDLFPKTVERIIVITGLALYHFKEAEIKRRIKIEDLKAITISTTSNQLIIHGNHNEYDYLYIYPNRNMLIKILQEVYKNKTGNDLLFCKKSDKDLSKFVVIKKERIKNPDLFKINTSELTSIKEYIEKDDLNKDRNSAPDNKKNIPLSKNIIHNIEKNSDEDLIKKLKEEKNKNNQLMKELDLEKKKVSELQNKIKLLEENNSKFKDSKKINELENEINIKNKELNKLKKMLENNDLVTSINPGEEIIAVNFSSVDQTINYPIACKNTTVLARLEEKLYHNYPEYKEYNTYLTVNGRVAKRFKTMEENKIENGNVIVLNIYD